jgi:hypothetical protein
MHARQNRQAHKSAQLEMLFADTLPSGANLTGSIFDRHLDDPHRATRPREIVGASKVGWRPFSTSTISKPMQRRSPEQYARCQR